MGIELAAPVYSSLSSVFFNTNANMSWQPYIDDHLLQALPQGGSLTHAAIFGQDGNAWANSPEFPVPDPAYVKKLVAAIDDAGALGDAGLKFGEIKYIMVQGETGAVIRGKRGQGGVIIKKTTTALLIGIYSEGVQPGDCNVLVENLGDYLIGRGM